MAAGDQRVGDRDAEPSSQMVVAGAREAQRLVADRARLVARRHLDGGDRDDAFKHSRHQRRGDAVIAIAPLLGDRRATAPRPAWRDARWRSGGETPARKASSLPVNAWPPIRAARIVARAVSPTSAATSTSLRRQPWRSLPPRPPARQAAAVRPAPNRSASDREQFAATIAAAFSGKLDTGFPLR